MNARPTSIVHNGRKGSMTTTFAMTDDDGLPVTIKFTVQASGPNPMRDAVEKLLRLMPGVVQVVLDDDDDDALVA